MAVEPQNKTLIPLHIFPARLTPVTSCAMLGPRTPSGLGNLFIFLTVVFPQVQTAAATRGEGRTEP